MALEKPEVRHVDVDPAHAVLPTGSGPQTPVMPGQTAGILGPGEQRVNSYGLPPDLWAEAVRLNPANPQGTALKLLAQERLESGGLHHDDRTYSDSRATKTGIGQDSATMQATAIAATNLFLGGDRADRTTTGSANVRDMDDYVRGIMGSSDERALMRDLGVNMDRGRFHKLLNHALHTFQGTNAPLASVALAAAFSDKDKSKTPEQKFDEYAKAIEEHPELKQAILDAKIKGDDKALANGLGSLYDIKHGTPADPNNHERQQFIQDGVQKSGHIDKRMQLLEHEPREQLAMNGYSGYRANHKDPTMLPALAGSTPIPGPASAPSAGKAVVAAQTMPHNKLSSLAASA